MFTDFPLGNTAGPPNDPTTQAAVVGRALGLAYSADEPGTILPLPHAWAEPWKDKARELIDHRTPRHDTPQYQEKADRNAAISEHGEIAACTIC